MFVTQKLLFSVASQGDQDVTRTYPYPSQGGLLEIPYRRGSLHEWLMSYLTDRCQFTEVNNCRSVTDYVRYGVPQGSLLGPRLYTIYVNDLPDYIDSGDLYMYADDTTVYCIGPNVDQVMLSK